MPYEMRIIIYLDAWWVDCHTTNMAGCSHRGPCTGEQAAPGSRQHRWKNLGNQRRAKAFEDAQHPWRMSFLRLHYHFWLMICSSERASHGSALSAELWKTYRSFTSPLGEKGKIFERWDGLFPLFPLFRLFHHFYYVLLVGAHIITIITIIIIIIS